MEDFLFVRALTRDQFERLKQQEDVELEYHMNL
jgi:hypothetical protein